jgi:nucleoside-diphosphate-sugar epimerase
MLRQAEHEVTGTTRSEQRASLIHDLGAEPAVVDAFDADGLRAAVAAAQPEVVIHQLTSIPKRIDPRSFEEQFEVNNRLRREGTRNLVEAARAAGARRVIAQSVAFFYEWGGGRAHLEDDPLDTTSEAGSALAELERVVTATEGIEGVVLRYGYLYGPGTGFASDGAQVELLRRRRFPIVGDGDARFPFIHVDDAGAAAVLALDHGAPGIYNVVDDDPAPVRDWLPYLAETVGAPKPRRVPTFLARLIGGEYGVRYMTRAEPASNEKAKRELQLELRYPSWRQGFRDALG